MNNQKGPNNALKLQSGAKFSYGKPSYLVYSNTEIDRWHVGDYSSASYIITVEFDSDQREILNVLVVGKPTHASYTVFGRTNIENQLVSIDVSVNASYVQVIANPSNSIYAGAKLTYTVTYEQTTAKLTVPTPVTTTLPTANGVIKSPFTSDLGFKSPGFFAKYDGTVSVSGNLNVSSTLTVTNDVHITGDLIQTGNTTLTGNVTHTGDYNLIGDIYFDGDKTTLPSSIVNSSLTSFGKLNSLYSNNSAPLTFSGVEIVDVQGQFSYTSGPTVVIGQALKISGVKGGTGSIAGYVDPTTYYVSAFDATNKTFTLASTHDTALLGSGGELDTTIGSPTGVTYSVITEINLTADLLSISANEDCTGYIDNIIIGETTPRNAFFATLVSDIITVDSDSSTITINPSDIGSIDNVNIGLIVPTDAKFTNVEITNEPTLSTHATTKNYVDGKATALAIALGA